MSFFRFGHMRHRRALRVVAVLASVTVSAAVLGPVAVTSAASAQTAGPACGTSTTTEYAQGTKVRLV